MSDRPVEENLSGAIQVKPVLSNDRPDIDLPVEQIQDKVKQQVQDLNNATRGFNRIPGFNFLSLGH
ncbi:MAG: hypothetical protein R3D71_09545 [Rickettsiales bacterium]